MSLVPGETQIGNYLMLHKIGSGAFSTVWLARNVITNVRVAIKVIMKKNLSTADDKTRFAREVNLLKQIRHPFIAEFFETLEDDNYHFLVMEYAKGGNMLNFINMKGQLTELQARHYFSQIISVLEYLHNEKMVAHRDLKAENVMLDRYNNIRVIDFGLSNQFTISTPELKTACGSPHYAAPEMIKGKPYTAATDIWSAGILLFSMVAGHLPYDDENVQRLLQKIVYTDVHYHCYMSPSLVDLLKKMLAKAPENRITLKKIREHPWFSQYEYNALINFQATECPGKEVINKEIVDKMVELGIDCHSLHQQLLNGDFTELTSMYRQLLKENITEKMKDVMHNVQKMVPHKKIDQSMKFNFQSNKQNDEMQRYQVRMPGRAVRNGNAVLQQHQNGAPRTLQAPAPVQIAARRLSRPVAVKRPIELGSQLGSHETP
ncbi:CAMK family protein kinase [Histomonas meleagridis]|uniref:CAMK family protein kinase n=1 Tax=Histomonas meleagridis TaxID=135588 RepID=UPI003559DA96|nr:CAMK family protein kinase [Histomonas meleagridis]KAH0802170.1 CAMK family protein kinase [Histomonas meleagridis]